MTCASVIDTCSLWEGALDSQWPLRHLRALADESGDAGVGDGHFRLREQQGQRPAGGKMGAFLEESVCGSVWYSLERDQMAGQKQK